MNINYNTDQNRLAPSVEIKRRLGLKGDSSDFQEWATEKQNISIDFWHKQNSDARIIVIGTNISLLFHQVKAIMSPHTPEHLLMNQIYMVLSAFQLILVALSYRSKVHSGKLVFNALCLLIPRMGVRSLDFEQTRGVFITNEDFK